MIHDDLGILRPGERKRLLEGTLLPVMEMFYSIQGEGRNTGKAAAFLRVGGCDVGCHWCDVKESWDVAVHPLTGLDAIIDYVTSFPAKALVITGGEPLNYNLDPLCSALKKKGVELYLETCGAYPLSGRFDWICLSPKKNLDPRPELLLMADELKVIIHSPEDLHWAEKHAELVKNTCLLYLQPEWSQYDNVLPRIVSHVKEHPRWMVSLQAHKFMHIP